MSQLPNTCLSCLYPLPPHIYSLYFSIDHVESSSQEGELCRINVAIEPQYIQSSQTAKTPLVYTLKGNKTTITISASSDRSIFTRFLIFGPLMKPPRPTPSLRSTLSTPSSTSRKSRSRVTATPATPAVRRNARLRWSGEIEEAMLEGLVEAVGNGFVCFPEEFPIDFVPFRPQYP